MALMKLLVLLLLIFTTSCSISKNSFEPIQVNRSVLTLDHIETKYRRSSPVCFIIWVDYRGMEYREEMEHVEDTTYMRKGLMFAQLLKK